MGEALRLLRIFNGYKSAELADMLEISQSYVSELENNKKSTLFLFAESLEIEKEKQDPKQRMAYAGMKLLKILEKVGGLENE